MGLDRPGSRDRLQMDPTLKLATGHSGSLKTSLGVCKKESEKKTHESNKCYFLEDNDISSVLVPSKPIFCNNIRDH